MHARSTQRVQKHTCTKYKHALEKPTNTKVVIRNQEHSKETNGAMERNDGKKDLGRDAWKERRRRASSLPDRSAAEPSAGGGRTTRKSEAAVLHSASLTVNRCRIPLEKKVYKMKSITASIKYRDVAR